MLLAPILWAFPVAAVLIAVGWRPWSGAEAPRTGPLASALAVPLCLALSWQGFHDHWPPLLAPGEAKEWLLPAAAVAALGALTPRRVALQAVPALVAAGMLVHLGFGEILGRQFEGQAGAVQVGLGVLVAGSALSLAALCRREGGEAPLLLLLGLVAAATVQRGGYASGALVLGGVGCGVGGALVVGLWRPRWSPLAGAGLAVGTVAAGVLLVGNRLSESPTPATLVALAVPQVGWIPLGGRRGVALRILLALGLAALAHWLSVPPPDPYSEYYG